MRRGALSAISCGPREPSEISRGGARILPDGDTVVHGGDILTVVCRTDRPEKVEEDLRDIAGDEKYKGKEPPEND